MRCHWSALLKFLLVKWPNVTPTYIFVKMFIFGPEVCNLLNGLKEPLSSLMHFTNEPFPDYIWEFFPQRVIVTKCALQRLYGLQTNRVRKRYDRNRQVQIVTSHYFNTQKPKRESKKLRISIEISRYIAFGNIKNCLFKISTWDPFWAQTTQ